MPTIDIEENYTPATVNTTDLTRATAARFVEHFGAERVREVRPIMAGEDFSQFHLADRNIESLIFWVGGVPQEQYDRAQREGTVLPSLHSPFWAPEPDATISTAVEALVVASLGVLGRR